jgi:hypothetical protein
MEELDLDEILSESVGTAKIKGVSVPQMPLDGAAVKLLRRLTSGDIKADESSDMLYQLVGSCLPSLSEEQVLALTIGQAWAVVNRSAALVKKVEAAAPPNSAPAGGKRKPARV